MRSPTNETQREVSFLTWRQAVFGVQSSSLDAGDFNGDGNADLAVLDGGLVVLLLGDGHGNFSPPLLHRPGGIEAKRLLARDFNHDGDVDVAVCYSGSGDVWVFLGDGKGGLSNGQRFATGGSPTAMSATDFDGDGNLDLAVALAGGSVNGYVQLLRNDGTAHFTSEAAAFAGRLPTNITVGDFDGDGRPDVAVTNTFDRTATVLFGDGAGGFTDRVTLDTAGDLQSPPLPWGAAAGDLNGDGLDDLVVGNGISDRFGPSQAGGLQQDIPVLFGNAALFISSGHRRFAPPVFLPADNYVRDLRILDADGDGRRDVVSGGGNGVLTLLARSDGSFLRRGSTVGALNGQALAAADFNGDGRVDFAVAGGAPRVDIFLNEGGSNLPSPFFLRTEPNPELGFQVFRPVQAATADLNGDGIVDLVTTTADAGTIVSFLGLGDGGFSRPLTSAVGRPTSWFNLADFDGDGHVDVALASEDNHAFPLDLFLGDGHGHFALGPRISGDSDYGKVTLGDFNNDGAADIVSVARRFEVPFVGADVFLNAGGGRFRRSASLSTNKVTVDALVADLDRDGFPDIVLINLNNVSVFLGRGNGTFADEMVVPAAIDGGIAGATLGDFDEDGFPDLAVSQGIGSRSPDQAFGNFWLHGDGHGRFVNPVHLTPEQVGLDTQGTFVGVMAVDDFNGDGHADIAVASNNGLTVFRGDGKGGFAPASSYFGMYTTQGAPLTVADLNGDGLLDVTTPAEGITADGRSAVQFTLLFNTTPPATIIRGDANCDEAVDGADFTALTRRLFNPLYRVVCSGADANSDGSLSVTDLVALVKRLVM